MQLAKLRQRQTLRAGEYWSLILEGCSLLGRVPLENRSVITFEQSNPFSAALRLRPTAYGFPLFWRGVAYTLEKYPAPERFFSDEDYVMVPVIPYDPGHLEALKTLYGAYLEENFEQTEQSPHWALWTRKADRVPSP